MSLLEKIRSAKRLTPREAALFDRFAAGRQPRAAGEPLKVLVQGAQDVYYYGLFGEIVNGLRGQRAVHAEQIVLKHAFVGDWRSPARYLRARFIEWLLARKWIRLYGQFCDGVGLRSGGSRAPFADLVDLVRARRIWRGLRHRDDLMALQIDGIRVGDLVNDSYLRFKPAPTVEIRDRYLWQVIWNALRQSRRARSYFNAARPDLLITSYSTYVHHGIPVRQAIAAGVRVISLGNYQEFMKELTARDWSHTRNPDAYAADFRALADPERCLAEAEGRIKARMSGELDSTYSYMRQSAYADSGEAVDDMRGTVCVFLHDFFDSPHVYRHLLFPDFWEWINFTIDALERSGRPFVLKPHPNQIEMSDGVLADLRARHPHLRILSARVTNRQLVDAGIACAVTVYGTVAHEMAYLGVPVITCGDHPHVSFDFCRMARSREEYAQLLGSVDTLPIGKDEARRQAIAFFYMHNLNLSSEMAALREAVTEFRSACHDGIASGPECARLLAELAGLAGFRENIMNLASGGTRESSTPATASAAGQVR